jgi:hypothetical protein
MTMIRLLAATAATVFAFAAGSARAEMKNESVEYSHGNTKLKAYWPTTTRSPASAPPCSWSMRARA